jgi:hypothetical protein
MASMPNKATSAVEKAAQQYSEQTALRAAIQLIPYVGGAIDTLVTGKANQIQVQRIEHFLHELRERLEHVEMIKANVDDDAFMDLMLTTFEKVSRARSTDKQSRFANIVSRQVIEAHPWEDVEMAVRLVSDLENIHIEVASAVISAPPCEKPFEGLRVVALTPPSNQAKVLAWNIPLLLSDSLPHYSSAALRMACAELMAKGLLYDEGVGRWDMGAMQYFVATDLAHWLKEWLLSVN